MSYFIEISIFGKVSDPEAVHELVEAVRDEEGLDEGIDESDVFARLQDASSRGAAVEFSGNGYDDVFHDVTVACQKAGLSYVWTIGESTGEGPTNGKAWKPGMSDEITFMMHDRRPGVALATIAAAAKLGIEAVNELVSTVASATRVGKIEFAPGFNEAYQAFLDKLEDGSENDDTDEDVADHGMRP